MNTTNIFVELVIIGLGAMIWLFLFFALVFGINILDFPFTFPKDFPSIIMSILFLSLTYLFGILVDRLADLLLTKSGNKLRATFFSDRGDIFKAKIKSYKIDPAFAAIFEYSRSRMRICRGWIINSFIILFFGNIYIWFGSNGFSTALKTLGLTPLKLSLFFSILLILIFISTFIFWKSLQKSEYAKLKKVEDLIPDQGLKI